MNPVLVFGGGLLLIAWMLRGLVGETPEGERPSGDRTPRPGGDSGGGMPGGGTPGRPSGGDPTQGGEGGAWPGVPEEDEWRTYRGWEYSIRGGLSDGEPAWVGVVMGGDASFGSDWLPSPEAAAQWVRETIDEQVGG